MTHHLNERFLDKISPFLQHSAPLAGHLHHAFGLIFNPSKAPLACMSSVHSLDWSHASHSTIWSKWTMGSVLNSMFTVYVHEKFHKLWWIEGVGCCHVWENFQKNEEFSHAFPRKWAPNSTLLSDSSFNFWEESTIVCALSINKRRNPKISVKTARIPQHNACKVAHNLPIVPNSSN